MPYTGKKKYTTKRKPRSYRRRRATGTGKVNYALRQISRLKKAVRGSTYMRYMHHENAPEPMLSTSPIIVHSLSSMDIYGQLWGNDHNTTTKLNIDKVYIPNIRLTARFTSWDQPDPVTVTAILAVPTKMSNERTVSSGGMLANYDYYSGSGACMYLNKKYWRILRYRKFVLGHYEFLSANPATNSNNPIGHSYFDIDWKVKTKINIKRGLDDSVWAKNAGDLAYNERYYFIVIHDNPSPTLDCRMEFTTVFPAIMPG